MNSPEPAVPDSDTDARYVAERLLLTVREDLGRADVKASVLLSGALAVPALLIGGGRAPGGVSGTGQVLLVGAAVLWAAGTVLLLGVILPRTWTVRRTLGPTFYADAVEARDDPEALLRGVAEAGRDPVRWLLTQFQDVSVILAAKYRFLRGALALLGAGLAVGAYALGAG